jgi:polyphenol oxidase
MSTLWLEKDVAWRVSQRPQSWDQQSLADGTVEGAQGVTWLAQPHGATCVTVLQAGEHQGAPADAAVTSIAGLELVIRTADCAPVLLIGKSASDSTVLGVAHAGWQGLFAGVIEATVSTMRDLGALRIAGWLGPCICSACYEFIGPERNELSQRYGPSVEGQTAWGTASLNLVAAIEQALIASEAHWGGLLPGWSCTSCDTQRYSHRSRRDTGRMGLAARIL